MPIPLLLTFFADTTGMKTVEQMAAATRAQEAGHGNYAVMAVMLAIWIGVFFYLFRMDGRVKKLEENKL